jgi:hypothetical protein
MQSEGGQVESHMGWQVSVIVGFICLSMKEKTSSIFLTHSGL